MMTETTTVLLEQTVFRPMIASPLLPMLSTLIQPVSENWLRPPEQACWRVQVCWPEPTVVSPQVLAGSRRVLAGLPGVPESPVGQSPVVLHSVDTAE
jgi:hypothetical protein